MAPNDDYAAVSLFTIPPDVPLPFGISVYYQGQFIRYRERGQLFETARFNRFIFKRIGKVYIAKAELEGYREFVRQQQAVESARVEDPRLTKEQQTTLRTVRSLDVVTKELFSCQDDEMDAATSKVVEVAKDTVQRICERPYLRIFESIPHNSSVIDHSMRVSLLSTFLGYQLGFVNPLALEHLAAAGLLHDIGKTRVVLEGGLEMTAEQEQLVVKLHPKLGADLLRKSPLVPEEVVAIVVEHHERRDGSGFPEGVRGRQLHGLTKVFSIANTFDNLVGELQGDRETRYRQAAEKMEKEMRAWFEPMLLPKALRLLTTQG